MGAGFAAADPPGPGPNIPGPNIPGPDVPGQNGPGPNVPGPNNNPICYGPGANCLGPGSPLPPGQNGFPPPGHYNDPVRYGQPATYFVPQYNQAFPVVFNPDAGAWGVITPDGAFIAVNA
ncbi:hypothetical protein GAN17_13120 [Mycobacterium kubicae]|nr:hypothetical protein GAN17_13120 [Mycobacterium kubicae]